MLKVAYIGKFNQTNSVICEAINSSYGADITFHDPSDIFSKHQTIDDSSYDLIIVDLNTSLGLGNTPDNIHRLNKQIQAAPLLVLHPYENNKLIEPLVEAGANSIITVTPSEVQLFQAIDETLKGNSFIIYPE